MARLRFPDIVDMAYAASAPMLFHSQQVSELGGAAAYYDHITVVADRTRPNCANHVRQTLSMVQYVLLHELPDTLENVEHMVVALGFCRQSQPEYVRTMSMLGEELMMIVAYTFANDNMANYTPTNWNDAIRNNATKTSLYQAFETFSSIHWDPIQIVSQFVKQHLMSSDQLENYNNTHKKRNKDKDCVNMSLQLPSGPNATLSGGDWSGVGTGLSGERWDFQTCTLLVEAIGFSKASMFPEREWSMDWLVQHCQTRFQVTPQPRKLVDEWHFDDLVGSTNASHILFTNGLNDGWSVGGILQNLSDTLLTINFENGAHHSDLTHVGPSDQDTPDIVSGFVTIRNILAAWLDEIQPGKYVREQVPGMSTSVK
ncbi:Serine carboxypeptidase S28 [Fragilaria crotonensis]|nr:Serine carboxypeptidase S28 [Fragilaria crotonensis]